MREIKFRGKSTSTKWLYGNLLTYTVNGVLWAKIWENDEDGKKVTSCSATMLSSQCVAPLNTKTAVFSFTMKNSDFAGIRYMALQSRGRGR